MTAKEGQRKVIFCCPTVTRPFPQFLASMEASVPALDAAGIDHKMVFEIGSAYISWARANMLRKALDTQPDMIIFLDHDMAWKPEDLLKLIQTPGDVVAGTYRFKQEREEYMGTWHTNEDGRPVTREDGCIRAEWVPAGFLKVTSDAVNAFMTAYPNLTFGSRYRPHIDLFNHGAHDGVWYGEDYAFSRNWRATGADIWIIPDLDLDHHSADAVFPGNFHTYLLGCPGGSNDPARAE